MLELLYRHISLQGLMWLVLTLPLAGAALNGLVALATARDERARFKPLVTMLGCGLPLISFAGAVALFFTLIGFEAGSPAAITGPLFSWALSPSLVIDVGLSADQLTLIMALVVSGVGSLIHIYSVGYMSHDAGFARYFAEMNLFLFFMLLIVIDRKSVV